MGRRVAPELPLHPEVERKPRTAVLPDIHGVMSVREVVAKSALEHMLLTEIRTHAGCEDVIAVEVKRVANGNLDVNWTIGSIGSGARGWEVANRAAEHAQHKLQNRFILA
jgi:hypothetical protein